MAKKKKKLAVPVDADGSLSEKDLEAVSGGMFPASTKGGVSAGPIDVCKLPDPVAAAVPVPTVAPTATAPKLKGAVVVVAFTTVQGTEPGTLKEVLSFDD